MIHDTGLFHPREQINTRSRHYIMYSLMFRARSIEHAQDSSCLAATTTTDILEAVQVSYKQNKTLIGS